MQQWNIILFFWENIYIDIMKDAKRYDGINCFLNQGPSEFEFGVERKSSNLILHLNVVSSKTFGKTTSNAKINESVSNKFVV